MFLKRTRGLQDLLLACLCIWGACYHTPLGAGFRGVASLVVGERTSVRTLLSYYNGGIYVPEALGREISLPRHALQGPVPETEALGYGLHASWSRAPERQRVRARELAQAAGIPPRSLDPEREGPRRFASLVRHYARELGTDEAAVIAIWCGLEPARYAVERVRAEHKPLELENLARQLPPGFEAELSSASESLMLGAAFALAWPAPSYAPVTSLFGPRLHPVHGGQRMHKGVDISLRSGSPVLAAGDGVVLRAGDNGPYGLAVTLDHGRGVTTFYAHNSHLAVVAGQRVRKGELLAESGSTGQSTGPHLHYQLELARAPVDPLRFRAAPASVAREAGP